MLLCFLGVVFCGDQPPPVPQIGQSVSNFSSEDFSRLLGAIANPNTHVVLKLPADWSMEKSCQLYGHIFNTLRVLTEKPVGGRVEICFS